MTPAVSGTGRGMLTRIGRAALVPWWTAQLLTGTKSFERNGVIGSRRLNRLRAARGAGTARARGRRNGAAGAWNSLVSAADRARFRARRVCRSGAIFCRRRNSPRCATRSRPIAARCARSPRATRSCARSRSIRAPWRRCRRSPALLRSPEWRGLIRYIGSRDAEPVVWIQSLSAARLRRPGRSADRAARRHLSSDGQGVAVPDRCRRRCRPVHLCAGLAPADPASGSPGSGG